MLRADIICVINSNSFFYLTGNLNSSVIINIFQRRAAEEENRVLKTQVAHLSAETHNLRCEVIISIKMYFFSVVDNFMMT